jgi:NPCBM/NEW2 domain/Concanavalin A-like lectin/glucanases superfamily/Putative Ig domain
VGVVTNTTSKAVSPPATMTYTLTASNASGSVTMPVTVTVSSAPVAYWKLDDGSGTTAADSSGNGHTMTLFNAPGWPPASSCAVNGCLAFNGTNQYGSSALDLSGTNVITVAFWLKWTAYANDDRIALEFTPNFNNASTGFLILPDESVSGQFQAGVQGNAGYNQVNFPRPSAGVWHHFSFVMDKSAPAATQLTPYLDGQPVSYTKPTAAANTNNFGNSALFAMSRNGTSLFGSGDLDELRIYPRALSAAEILSLATAISPTITTTSPLSAGTVGLAYSQTLASSGSTPITWTVTSGALPAGLSFSSSSGIISGTPKTAGAYSFIVQATNSAGSDSQQFSLTVNPNSAALNYNVSNLNWMSATIGWGTIHKNASVLGNVLTLNGVTYTEGIGTHADSQIVYNIGGSCNTFQSDVGIDDEVGSSGLVDFQVFGDGVKLYDSVLMTGSSATQKISVSVAGRNQLSLTAIHGGTNINFDHADWANPRLTCSSAPPAAN